MNGAMFFFLASSVFLFIRIIGVLSSGGSVAVGIKSCVRARVPESVRFGGGGVLVYGGITIDGRTDLYIIRDGPLTARRYSDEILRPIVVPYAAAIGDDFILMDDNCTPHRANLVEDFLFEEGIVRREWPVSGMAAIGWTMESGRRV
ncbi:transposable element Tcb2 transposase [Trichonephila clavipes]|nr:transposable element Tcb2 transposase [Trichonephila clavipes]